MPDTNVFAGVDQPDVASLDNSGTFFRCYVYRNMARNTIDYALFTELEQGQSVLIVQGVLRDVENDSDVPFTSIADMPRVLAVRDRYFVAHWFEGRAANGPDGLYRAILDTDAIASGWSLQGDVPVGNVGLYDAHVVEGTADFVVTYIASTTTNITTARYQFPYSWVDSVWSDTSLLNPEPTSIGVVSDATNTVVLYQSTAQELYAVRYDADDGGNVASNEIFDDFGTSVDDIEVCAVAACTTQTANEIIVVAEVCLAADETTGATGNAYADRYLIWKSIRGSNVTSLTSAQYCPNLHMVSRPISIGSALTATDNVYVLCSFRSIADGQEWDQSYGFVVNLVEREWGAGVDIGAVRPIPVSAINTGAMFDGRRTASSLWTAATDGPSLFGKRMSHLSNFSGPPQHALGPDATAYTAAAVFWEKLVQEQDSDVGEGQLQPANASIRGVRFHHVDPWTVRLGALEPALSASENFKGVAPYSAGRSVEVAGGVIMADGCLSTYDGRQVVETGFLWRPEILRAFAASATTALDAGTYWYTCIYEWTDSTGRVHRSAPARPVSVTLASDDEVTLEIRTIPLTLKDNRLFYPGAANVSLVVYRTALSATTGEPETAGEAPEIPSTTSSDLVFRMAFAGPNQTIQETPTNSSTAARITVGDVNPNSVVRYTDLLPWQMDTGTLQWSPATPIPTPSARVMTTWNNRVWIVSPDDPRVIRYSDEILPIGSQTAAPEFFDSNVFRFDSRGDITAMQAMDNALIVFTRDAIYAMTGTGNDGTGTGATLALQVIAEGTGCIEPRSVVLAPPGIMFQSPKGFYLLSRELTLDYVSAGAAVEDEIRAMGNVRAATLLDDRHEIRLVGNAAPVSNVEQPMLLIYDYLHRMWSTAPMPNMAGASTRLNALQAGCSWRGREGEVCHVVMCQNGLAVERGSDDTVFADQDYTSTNVAIPIDVSTDWIHIAGIAGFTRMWRIAWMTDRRNAGEMSYDLYLDRRGEYDDDATPQSGTWRSPAPALGIVKPRWQKVNAFRARLYESGTVPLTENVRITGLTAKVGILPGHTRVSDANTGSTD